MMHILDSSPIQSWTLPRAPAQARACRDAVDLIRLDISIAKPPYNNKAQPAGVW